MHSYSTHVCECCGLRHYLKVCEFCTEPFRSPASRIRFCSKRCSRRFREAGTLAARFMAKVQPVENGCLRWIGTTLNDGYGVISFEGKRRLAHRVAWELKHGPIPDGMHVCHHCDNRWCVNADGCLFLGTPLDNMRDKIAKGRQGNPAPNVPAVGVRNGHATQPERTPRGEMVERSVLTPDLVQQIRERVAQGERQTALAREIGVSKNGISAVVRGKTWRHV